MSQKCCEFDHDNDGNCHVHSEPGVFRVIKGHTVTFSEGLMQNCVMQEWTFGLSMMMQAVLLTAVRGPDTIRKDHVAKLLLRWYRRCIIKSAFSRATMTTPWGNDGGSFTGPSVEEPYYYPEHVRTFEGNKQQPMTDIVTSYLSTVDELPHHFQLHLMHGTEILGYKHPDEAIRNWWHQVYLRIVNDMHLEPETEAKLNYRLGDKEANWRACEEVTAKGPNQ